MLLSLCGKPTLGVPNSDDCNKMVQFMAKELATGLPVKTESAYQPRPKRLSLVGEEYPEP